MISRYPLWGTITLLDIVTASAVSWSKEANHPAAKATIAYSSASPTNQTEQTLIYFISSLLNKRPFFKGLYYGMNYYS